MRSAVLAIVTGLVLAACGDEAGDSETDADPPAATSAPESDTSLTVTVDPGEGGSTEEWTLTCDPPAGTHPDPEAACATLDHLDPSVMEPVPPDQMCTQIYGGPQTATVSGTWNGEPLVAEFSRQNGCEIDRWDAVVDLLVNPGGEQTE